LGYIFWAGGQIMFFIDGKSETMTDYKGFNWAFLQRLDFNWTRTSLWLTP